MDFNAYGLMPETVDAKWSAIENLRNRALAITDWTQLPDAPLTEAQKAEWQTYREALQVIEFSNPNPDLIVFPDPPVFTNSLPPAEVTDFRASRADLKAQAVTALARLTQIETAVNPTNAEVGKAVRDMAMILRKVVKILVKII